MRTEKEIQERLDNYKKKLKEKDLTKLKSNNKLDLDEYWDEVTFYKKRIQILEWVLN